jgi:hypothetical protein
VRRFATKKHAEAASGKQQGKDYCPTLKVALQRLRPDFPTVLGSRRIKLSGEITSHQRQSSAVKLAPGTFAMAEFNPNPYRGEASIPHVSEDFFKIYFVGAQVNLIHRISTCIG